MADDLRDVGDPSSDLFRVEAYPFYQLNRTASRYNVMIEERLRTIDLEILAWRVLLILGETSPLPISHIAKSAVINLSTMMRLVERMKKAGLVTSVGNADDGRVTDLVLTDVGKEKLAAARKLTAPMYKQIIRGFSRSNFNTLLELLDRLHNNLE